MAMRSDKESRQTLREVNRILRCVDELPVLNNRNPDEIIGYDEDGAPSDARPGQDASTVGVKLP